MGPAPGAGGWSRGAAVRAHRHVGFRAVRTWARGAVGKAAGGRRGHAAGATRGPCPDRLPVGQGHAASESGAQSWPRLSRAPESTFLSRAGTAAATGM